LPFNELIVPAEAANGVEGIDHREESADGAASPAARRPAAEERG
jgi:hypothetical protein